MASEPTEAQRPVPAPVPAPASETGGPAADTVEEVARVQLLPGGTKAAVEAILMVADQAVNEMELAEALLVPVRSVQKALEQIARDYDGYGTLSSVQETEPTAQTGAAAEESGYTGESSRAPAPRAEPRGMELRQVAGGWKLYSRAEFAPWVARFVLEGQSSKLSQAALETLAVIAYRQPVSRAKVSSIRGVNVDGVVRTLKTRGLVEETEQPGESGAILYATTPLFLEKIGLDSLEDLPKISPYLPGAEDAGEYEQRL